MTTRGPDERPCPRWNCCCLLAADSRVRVHHAARRDSGQAMLLRQIAGRENLPAESVFKNIEVMKGVPAGRLVRIMNAGFGRTAD